MHWPLLQMPLSRQAVLHGSPAFLGDVAQAPLLQAASKQGSAGCSQTTGSPTHLPLWQRGFLKQASRVHIAPGMEAVVHCPFCSLQTPCTHVLPGSPGQTLGVEPEQTPLALQVPATVKQPWPPQAVPIIALVYSHAPVAGMQAPVLQD